MMLYILQNLFAEGQRRCQYHEPGSEIQGNIHPLPNPKSLESLSGV